MLLSQIGTCSLRFVGHGVAAAGDLNEIYRARESQLRESADGMMVPYDMGGSSVFRDSMM